MFDLIGIVYPVALDNHQPGEGDREHDNSKDDHPLLHRAKLLKSRGLEGGLTYFNFSYSSLTVGTDFVVYFCRI